jgi:hypothetical protein
MTEQSEDERIAELIGSDQLANLPKWIHDEFGNQGECTECGEQTLCFAPEMYDTPYVCYTCGTEYTYYEMPEPVVEEVADEEPEESLTAEEKAEQTVAKRKEAQLKSKQNLSKLMIVLGIMFCVTVIGLPIGAALIYLGVRIGPDPEEMVDVEDE